MTGAGTMGIKVIYGDLMNGLGRGWIRRYRPPEEVLCTLREEATT